MNADPDDQHPFWSFGFRPFFLFAGCYGVIAMAAWLAWLTVHSIGATVTSYSFTGAPYLWHGHEMLFGYISAVISGFMLTAVPNWTGARRVAGAPLMALAGLWLAGRVVMWFSAFLPAWLVAVIDLAHLPALAVMVAAGLFINPVPRNLIFVALITLLTIANGAVHAQWLGFSADSAEWGLKLALLTYCLMVTIIGGRVVPSFTRNALMRRTPKPPLPKSFAILDRLAILSSALTMLFVLFGISNMIVGPIAIAAGIANGARLMFWRGQYCLRQPILWSLHAGFGFLVLGYIFYGCAVLDIGISEISALHLLAVGAIGGMTLAVMTRAALGHTGRPLHANNVIGLAYGLIIIAALIRGFALYVLPSHYFAIMLSAGSLWVAGFSLFVFRYFTILTGPSRKAASQA